MERHIGVRENREYVNMVKLRPDKMNLEEGYTASPTIFKNMGLYVGDKFENKYGVRLIVKEDEEIWKVEKVEV